MRPTTPSSKKTPTAREQSDSASRVPSSRSTPIEALANPVYNGLIESSAGNLFHFLTVGSTGAIVVAILGENLRHHDRSVRLPEQRGGHGHAVEVVGMFDLPENRTVDAPPVPATPTCAYS